MTGVVSEAAAAAAYGTASQSVVFASVALAFVGVGWALALVLRPKTCAMCVWSMAVFSFAWLIESTTHLLGVGRHADLEIVRYGVWVAVGLFGVGLMLGIFGVMAYVRNEHRYERGLVIGVFATLANLWVVGGIVHALRNDQVAALGRGLVIPLMATGGPMDEPAILAQVAGQPETQDAAAALRLTSMLTRVVSDMAKGLSDDRRAEWEIADESANDEGTRVLGALRQLHPPSQQRLTLSTEPGWMSLSLSTVGNDPKALAERAREAEAALTALRLALMPQRRLRATRTHVAGFEVVRTSSEASIKGVAGAHVFDFWMAAAGDHVLEVWSCSTSDSQGFFDATQSLVTDVLRTLQREGVAGPRYSLAIQQKRMLAHAMEKQGRVDDALTAWQQAGSDTPGDAEVVLGVVRCAWKLSKTKEALAWIEAQEAAAADGVAAEVGMLRLRTAMGQTDAHARLAEHFQSGLADDEAFAALLLGFAGAGDRASTQAALTAYADRHAATLVSWWQGYLASPPVASPAANRSASPPDAARPAGSADTTSTVAPGRPSAVPTVR